MLMRLYLNSTNCIFLFKLFIDVLPNKSNKDSKQVKVNSYDTMTFDQIYLWLVKDLNNNFLRYRKMILISKTSQFKLTANLIVFH